MADRIAGCLWRLNRAVLVETAVMDDAFHKTLNAGVDEFTPADRFRRAMIASVNNACLDPTRRLPINPGALRFTLPIQALAALNTDPTT